MEQLLCRCGKVRRKGGRQCSGCYMAKYRSTEKGKKACLEGNRRWRARNPDKVKHHDTAYKKQWRARTHFYVPEEVHELRKALKRLEAALVKAQQHQGVRCSG